MRRSRLLALGLLLLLAPALPARAQSGGSQESMKFRFGAFFPQGSSEFWDVNEQVFTIDSSDFDDFMFGASYVTALSNHMELGFNADFYDAGVRSAYRNFVDQNNNPILHDTWLRLAPFTMDVRFLPGGRYAVRGEHGDRRVLKPVFYLGVGAGVNYWRYEEAGDFVGGPITNLTIAYDRLTDDGFAPEAHALAGVEFPVGPAWSFGFEGRYSWSEATPGGQFSSLDQGKLDLSGVAVFGGFSVQF